MQRNFSWENSEEDLTSQNKEILTHTHTSQNTPRGIGQGRTHEQLTIKSRKGRLPSQGVFCSILYHMCTSPLARVLCVTHEMPFVSFLCCWELVELGNCKIRISVQCLNVDWLLFDLPLAGPLTACSRSSRGAPPWTACRPSSRWWCWCCCWWPWGTCRGQ